MDKIKITPEQVNEFKRVCQCCGDLLEETEIGPECEFCRNVRKRLAVVIKKLEILDEHTKKLQKEYSKLTGQRWIAPIRW